MIQKFKIFTKLSVEEKKLFLEAYVILGIVRVALLSVSFKRMTQKLGHSPKPTTLRSLNDEESFIANQVGQAITRASAYTPWKSTCLVQSLTAQRMLAKRGIPGVFYLGVAKDSNTEDKMKAHAWTQCGDDIVTGKSGHEAFTIVSVFAWGIE